jgi:hypothetical protein
MVLQIVLNTLAENGMWSLGKGFIYVVSSRRE